MRVGSIIAARKNRSMFCNLRPETHVEVWLCHRQQGWTVDEPDWHMISHGRGDEERMTFVIQSDSAILSPRQTVTNTERTQATQSSGWTTSVHDMWNKGSMHKQELFWLCVCLWCSRASVVCEELNLQHSAAININEILIILKWQTGETAERG